MTRSIDFTLLESKVSFLPERLRNTAVCMFASPRRAAAWIGLMTCETIDLADKHQPSPEHVERLQELFLELFPDHDPELGTHRMLSGVPVMYPVQEICTHVYG